MESDPSEKPYALEFHQVVNGQWKGPVRFYVAEEMDAYIAASTPEAAPSVDDVLSIRCMFHRNVPQENTNAAGAECAVCMADAHVAAHSTAPEAAGLPIAWMVERAGHEAAEFFTDASKALDNSCLGINDTRIVPLFRCPEAAGRTVREEIERDEAQIEDTISRGAFFQDWRLASLAAKKGHRAMMVTAAGDFIVLTDMQELQLRESAVRDEADNLRAPVEGENDAND